MPTRTKDTNPSSPYWRYLGRPLCYHLLPGALLIYLGLGAVLYVFQGNVIYHPDDTPTAECPELPAGTEVVRYGQSGTRGYYEDAGDPLVVLYHGNAGRACDRAWIARALLAPADVSFLLVEYTGYGGDEKTPSATAIRSNVRDTIAFARERGHTQVRVMGQSLGAAAATYHAAAGEVAALLLSTPFASYQALARVHYPLYPTAWLLRERFPVAAYLAEVTAPTTIIHGDADRIVPLAHAEYLREVSGSSDTQLIVVPGAGHNDIYATTQWIEAARSFVVTD